MTNLQREADNLQREADLVCEALVREIRDANRWSAVKEAWEALLHVRRMSREMIAEQEHLATSLGTMLDKRG